MDYRLESFRNKMNSANIHLKSSSDKNIISIKFRGNCVSNSDYSNLVDYIKDLKDFQIC